MFFSCSLKNREHFFVKWYYFIYMDETDNNTIEIEQLEDKSCAWNPEDGITLEWWGRAEGLEDKQ